MLVLVFLFTKTSLDVFHGNASLLEKESFPGCYRVRRTNREREREGERKAKQQSYQTSQTVQMFQSVRRDDVFLPHFDFSMTCAEQQCNNLFLKRKESDFCLRVLFLKSSKLSFF